jgi:uncharacterized membrane protein HdeD (DUF308 family)
MKASKVMAGNLLRVIAKYWWVYTLRGIIAMIFGLVTLFRSTLTLYEVVMLFGIYALFDAGLTIATCFGKGMGKGAWPILLEGVMGSVGCFFVLVISNLGSLLWPQVAATMLMFYIAGWAITTGLFKTITAFKLRQEVKAEKILGLAGVISILLGMILIARAGSGVLAVTWLIGIYAIVLSILLILMSLQFRRMTFK